ncbi:hypothetical protein D3C74_337610 [compost metagenome]
MTTLSYGIAFATPNEDNVSNSAIQQLTPGGHEGAEKEIKDASFLSAHNASDHSKLEDSEDSNSLSPQSTQEEPPIPYAYNDLGTGRWSSRHFITRRDSLEVGSKAWLDRGSATSSRNYYIQMFKDTLFSSTALGTYRYNYATSRSNAQMQYGQWELVGQGEYNIEAWTDGPYIAGNGNITDYVYTP